MKPGTVQQLVTALTEIARFSDSEDQQDEIIAFRWHAVKLAREALTATGHEWRPPTCREHGEPFDDNPGKDICKTCEDWIVTDGGA